MQELTESRKQIDEIDRQIADLYCRRMAVSREVAAYKLEKGLPVLDAQREQEVLRSRAALAREPVTPSEMTELFEAIMAGSRALQEKMISQLDPEKEQEYQDYLAMRNWQGEPLPEQRVLYQGQPGAYCEEAAMGFFGPDCQRMNLKTWDGIFRGVRDGFGDYGVVPIENSSTGSINEVYDLLGQFGCYIIGEQLVRVEQCLMALPGTDLDAITDVYSHEQGFLQCREFLGRFPKWNHHEMVNTALAAKYVAESGSKTIAAIASHRAAELYGLEVLQTAINENRKNYTRFIIVAADPRFPADADKISVRFNVPHREGSLCRVLEIFARAGLNLEKLESRPVPEESWKYSFYADFTGNLRQENMDLVIRELMEASIHFRVLGNYRAARL